MKIVGLTGGIGSGKSTVARAFQKFDVPVYIADDRSKYLLSNNKDVILKVTSLLGNKAYINVNGKVDANRAYIASQVFNDKKLLKKLNEILHPAVHKDFEQFTLLNKESLYIIYEAAILFETGGASKCDFTILVTASREERIKRVMQRDDVSLKDVESRMQHQWSQKQKLDLSNFVVYNDYIDLLPLKVRLIHEFMINTD